MLAAEDLLLNLHRIINHNTNYTEVWKITATGKWLKNIVMETDAMIDNEIIENPK